MPALVKKGPSEPCNDEQIEREEFAFYTGKTSKPV